MKAPRSNLDFVKKDDADSFADENSFEAKKADPFDFEVP